MPELEYISPRSEEIQDIMERPPSWMMRWGITLFFSFIILLLSMSWFIRYPDVINTSVLITSQNPPISLVAQSSGNLKRLLIKDKESVDSNAVLALIDNPADFDHVQSLKKMLSSIAILLSKGDSINIDVVLPSYQLGDMQTSFSNLKQALEEYESFQKVAMYNHKIRATQKQAKFQETLYERILQQFQTLTQEYQL
jgi:multidrug resistance efflux pump